MSAKTEHQNIFSTHPNDAHNNVHNSKHAYTHLNHHYHYHIYTPTVMWSPKGTYFNILKLLNTRRSVSAMAPSSPISLHWISSHSRLDIYIRKLNETQIHVCGVCYSYITSRRDVSDLQSRARECKAPEGE